MIRRGLKHGGSRRATEMKNVFPSLKPQASSLLVGIHRRDTEDAEGKEPQMDTDEHRWFSGD